MSGPTMFGLLALGACAGSPSYMRPSGPAAAAEATLGWWLTGTAAAVVLLVLVALGIAIFRRRPTEGDRRARPSARRVLVVEDGRLAGGSPSSTVQAEDEPASPTGDVVRRGGDQGLSWIYVGTAGTIVILIIAFIGITATLRAASHPPTPPAVTLDITGHQWWWEGQYHDSRPEDAFTTANEFHIPVGRPVRVRLHTADVIHSFWVPELAGKTDLIPGQVNETWIEASRPGRYRGQCTEYCGLEHAKMALYVVADPPAEFARWAAAQRQEAPALVPAALLSSASGGANLPAGPMPATTPMPAYTGANLHAYGPPVPDPGPVVAPSAAVVGGVDSLARAGQAVFLANCGACHAIRGSDALGRVGPDLTHVASRAYIAGGILPNTTGNLTGWIANAQGIKPGARMPTLQLPPNDLLAVVHYLQTLR